MHVRTMNRLLSERMFRVTHILILLVLDIKGEQMSALLLNTSHIWEESSHRTLSVLERQSVMLLIFKKIHLEGLPMENTRNELLH